MAVAAAAACALLAVLWALAQLRAVCTVVAVDTETLAGQLERDHTALEGQQLSLQTRAEGWQAELAAEISDSRTQSEAEGAANATLVEVDGQLSPAGRIFAACARVSVFGCLLGVALLYIKNVGLSMAVVDVFAIGAAGVAVALRAGREARRVVAERRLSTDRWIDAMLRARWERPRAEDIGGLTGEHLEKSAVDA